MIVVASNIFPVPELAQWNYTWPVKRTPLFKTVKQVPADNTGEVHISLTPFPVWEWDLDIPFMKGDAAVSGSNSAWSRIVGFYGSQRGSFNSWYYQDPYDNGVDENGNLIVNNIGVGDGQTAVFQTTRFIGGMPDLVQNYAVIPNVFLNGFAIPQAGVDPPPNQPFTTTTPGGSLPNSVYYVLQTYVTLNGETQAGPLHYSGLVLSGNLLVVAPPAANPAAVGWNVYISSPSAIGPYALQNITPISMSDNYTEPVDGLSVGENYGLAPSANSTVLAPPPNPGLSGTASGSLPATTYYVSITYVNPVGETLASYESTTHLAAHYLLGVASPPAYGGATGYKVYAGTLPGRVVNQTLTPIPIGEAWSEAVLGLYSGVAYGPPPVVNTTGIQAPAAPVLSAVAGGVYPATRYYVTITYVTPAGETTASTEEYINVPAFKLPMVASPPSYLTATGWNVYIGYVSSGEGRQNATPIALGTNYTLPVTGLGVTPPVTNNTGWDIDIYGNLTFGQAPQPTVAVSWSGRFYFRCFFDQDNLPLQEDLWRIWSIKSLKFHSTLR